MPNKALSIDRHSHRSPPYAVQQQPAGATVYGQHTRQPQYSLLQQNYRQGMLRHPLQRQEQRQQPPRQQQCTTNEVDEDDDDDDNDNEGKKDMEDADGTEANDNNEDDVHLRYQDCQRHRLHHQLPQHQHQYKHQLQEHRRYGAGPLRDSCCPRLRSISTDRCMESETFAANPNLLQYKQQLLLQPRQQQPRRHHLMSPHEHHQLRRSFSRLERRYSEPSPTKMSIGSGAQSSDANSCGSINNSGWCDDPTYECRLRLRGRPMAPMTPPPPMHQLEQQQQHLSPIQHSVQWSPVQPNQQQQQQHSQESFRRHIGRRYPERARIYSVPACNTSAYERRSVAAIAPGETGGGAGSEGAPWGVEAAVGGGEGGDAGVGGGLGGGRHRCRHQVQLLIQVMDCGCLTDDQSCCEPVQHQPPTLPPPPGPQLQQQHQSQPQRHHLVKCHPVWGNQKIQAEFHHEDTSVPICRDSGGGGDPQSTSQKVHRVTLPCCCRMKQ